MTTADRDRALAMREARSLSRHDHADGLVTRVYQITCPDGGTAYWIRFTRKPERRVGEVTLEPIAAFRLGKRLQTKKQETDR